MSPPQSDTSTPRPPAKRGAASQGAPGSPACGSPCVVETDVRQIGVPIGRRPTSAVPGDPGSGVNPDATRREAANGAEMPEHGVMLRARIRR